MHTARKVICRVLIHARSAKTETHAVKRNTYITTASDFTNLGYFTMTG